MDPQDQLPIDDIETDSERDEGTSQESASSSMQSKKRKVPPGQTDMVSEIDQFIAYAEETIPKKSRLGLEFAETTSDIAELIKPKKEKIKYDLEVGPFKMQEVPFYDVGRGTQLYRALLKEPAITSEEIVVKRQLFNQMGRMELNVIFKFNSTAFCPTFFGSALKDGYIYIGQEKLCIDFYDAQLLLKDQHYTPISAGRLMIQAIGSIEGLHIKGYAHGDIKPSNFMISRGDSNGDVVKLVDHGLCRPWTNKKGEPREPRFIGQLMGTARYASLAVHDHYEPSRPDDLVSLFWTFAEMVGSPLPFLEVERVRDFEAMKNLKAGPHSMLNVAKKFGPEIEAFAASIENLRYDTTPNYAFLKQCFKRYLIRHNFDGTQKYDWLEQNVDLNSRMCHE